MQRLILLQPNLISATVTKGEKLDFAPSTTNGGSAQATDHEACLSDLTLAPSPFQLAEVAVTGLMVRAILAAIQRLRAPPTCA